MAYIIAEIGINHNGDIEIAKELIKMASSCGADAVKFQKRTVDQVYTQEFLDSPRESPWGTTQREQKEGLEFNYDEYDQLYECCEMFNITWLASAWDLESLNFVESYNPLYHKIASPMFTNLGFIKEVANIGKLTFISTGMSTMEDIQLVVDIFKNRKTEFVLFHCVSIYPCPEEYCNLGRLEVLQKKFKCREIGYSGHEVGVNPTKIAIAKGAKYIERHITLNRAMYGSDQAASLEPKGLIEIVEFNKSMGKCFRDSSQALLEEAENAKKLRYWEG